MESACGASFPAQLCPEDLSALWFLPEKRTNNASLGLWSALMGEFVWVSGPTERGWLVTPLRPQGNSDFPGYLDDKSWKSAPHRRPDGFLGPLRHVY